MIFMYKGGVFTQFPGGVVAESTIGTDPLTLSYPNVSSCTTVTVVLDDNSMIGVHLDKISKVFEVYALLQKVADLARGHEVMSIAIIGAIMFARADGFMAKKEFAYPKLISTIAEAFDYTGIVWIYDQGQYEKHYRVRSIGGGMLAVTSMGVGTKVMSGMKVSMSFEESATGAWDPVPLAAQYIAPPFHI